MARLFGARLYCSLSTNYIRTVDYDRVRLIEINRPSVRNAVNEATAKELFSAFEDFEKNPALSVGILAGNGGNFCSGYDLKELASKDEVPALSSPFSVSSPAPMVKLIIIINNLHNY